MYISTSCACLEQATVRDLLSGIGKCCQLTSGTFGSTVNTIVLEHFRVQKLAEFFFPFFFKSFVLQIFKQNYLLCKYPF
jgi:hypothetical protein